MVQRTTFMRLPTDWSRIADELRIACPSSTLRRETVALLQLIEPIGPLRSPPIEFQRVYRSLHWNDASHLRRVVELLRWHAHRPEGIARSEAWGYVMAVHDQWITQARILYLVLGILESALRVRVHVCLSDYFATDDWPNVPEAVPSGIRKRLEGAGSDGHNPLPSGDVFLREHTSFFDLVMWFEGKRFWNDPIGMHNLFRGMRGHEPAPQFEKLRAVLRRLQAARNDIAHYRPGPDLSFTEQFFAASTLSAWLGEDLQHVYGAIDSRATTELSALLTVLSHEPSGGLSNQRQFTCMVPGCTVPGSPLEVILERAPRDHEELRRLPVNHACLYHRVQLREAFHRQRRRGSPLP